LNGAQILGICLFGRHRDSEIRSILGLGKPTVAVDFDGRIHGLDSVCFDNRRGGDLLARRLYLLGHRRIMAVFENPQKPAERQDEAWTQRRDGFLTAWQKTGAPAPTIHWLQQRGEMDSVLSKLEPIFHDLGRERPTALVLPIMPSMESVQSAGARLGLEVPRQLTVVAFDHCAADKKISGIRFNGFSMGEMAIKTLINALFNQRRTEGKPKLIHIPGRFVASESHARVCQSATPPTGILRANHRRGASTRPE
jgi:DNA-binding LacI/PurR family transcriptional regulator